MVNEPAIESVIFQDLSNQIALCREKLDRRFRDERAIVAISGSELYLQQKNSNPPSSTSHDFPRSGVIRYLLQHPVLTGTAVAVLFLVGPGKILRASRRLLTIWQITMPFFQQEKC